MKKCIIFSRVSTDRQHLEEQEQKISALASSHGYSLENQIFISEKESGIKLSEEERLGLTELKKAINDDPEIDAVYIFAVSRLGRTQKVVYSIRDFLIEKKVQLIIAEPFTKLLNDDKSINPGSEIIFTIYALLAEQEMREKKERFKLGRARAKKLGRFHGGPHAGFGFTVNPEGVIVPDEEEASIIIEIFRKYISGYSILRLRKWLNEERGVTMSGQNIKLILTRASLKNLVGEELFNQAAQVREEKKNSTGEDRHRLYNICEKLIKCPKCGRFYTARSNGVYTCVYHDLQRKDTDAFCENSAGLSMMRMDSIAITVATQWQNSKFIIDSEERNKTIEEKLLNLPKSIEALQNKISGFAAKLERVADNYIDGLIDKKKRDKQIEKLRAEELEYRKQLTQKRSELEYYSDLKQKNHLSSMLNLYERVELMNREELYFLVHENIKVIELKIEYDKKILDIYGFNDEYKRFIFKGQARSFHLIEVLKSGGEVDVTQVADYNRRELSRRRRKQSA